MPYSLKQKLGVFFLAAVIMMSAVAILSQNGRVPAHPSDQAFVTTADLRIGQENSGWYFHYPHLQWSGGITGSLAVGVYKLIVPTSPEHLNHHIKIFAMILFFIAGYLLASQYLKTRTGLLLFIAIMATAGFQLMDPTSELIATAYLLAFLYGIAKGWNFIITTFLLACFGLSKAELPLVAAAMMLCWVWVSPSRRLKMLIIGSFILWVIFFIAPGLYLYGGETIAGGRAFAAFSDHYVRLMAKYKLLALPPDLDFPRVLRAEFPGARSLVNIIAGYPQKYLTYVSICALTNLLVFMRVFKAIAGVLALRLIHYKEKMVSNHFEPMVLTGFIALAVPHTLVAAFRARYLLKFFVPFALLSIVFWEYCRERSDKPAYRWQAWISFVLLILTIILQIVGLRYLIEKPYLLDFIG